MRVFGYNLAISTPRLSVRSAGDVSDLKNPLDWFLNFGGVMGASPTGITVTPMRALGVATFFSCVRLISGIISTLPIEIRQTKDRKIRMATDHPLYPLLSLRPNPSMSSVDWRAAVQKNLCMFGNGYSQIKFGNLGFPSAIYPIENGQIDCQTYWFGEPADTVRKYFMVGSGREVPQESIIHLKDHSFNGFKSVNTTGTVRDVIALALALQDNAAKFFGNNSRPGGVLQHPLKLSKEAQDRLIKTFNERAGGDSLYGLAVLEEGMTYSATRSENRDSQFTEARDAQTLEICRIFGVPPQKMGVTAGSIKSNVEEENLAFISDVIRPKVVAWEQELTRQLLSDDEIAEGYAIYLNLDALERGNSAARFTTYASGRQWGIYSANDCRVAEGLTAVDGGDTYLQPINMVDATKATELLMKNAAQQTSESEPGMGGKPQKPTTPSNTPSK